MMSSSGRKPRPSNIRMPYVRTAVTPMPAMRGICSSSDSPIAPPRNSARSVAIAATSLTIHRRPDHGLGEMVAAHLGQVAPRDDAELGRQRLKQHGGDIGHQHHPQQRIAVFRAGLDVGGEIAGVHIGDRGDHRRAGEQERAAPAHLAGQNLADVSDGPIRHPVRATVASLIAFNSGRSIAPPA